MIRAELIRPPQAATHTPHDEMARDAALGNPDEFRAECCRWHAINAGRWMRWAKWWKNTSTPEQATINTGRANNEAAEAEYWAARQHLIARC